MKLIAVRLAGMREEMIRDREAQPVKAHEQARKVDEQARHLVKVL